jgi:hypothetical protein
MKGARARSFTTSILSMNTYTHPGEGLSLPQLSFALNEELRRMAYSPPYVERERLEERRADRLCRITLDAVSRLEQDILSALAAARELKNSFVRINRIPLDVLSLIPTHLPSQKDRFHTTFVCRHWRRVFLQHAALWSQLFLEDNEDYVTTLLERAKGSALEVITDYHVPHSTATLLSPHAQQIRHLEFQFNCWTDVFTFSRVNSGPLPLLRTLRIRTNGGCHQHGKFGESVVPPLPLLSGAVNLEEFFFNFDSDFDWAAPLGHFAFPKLTTLQLTASSFGGFNTSDLFTFLKASPMLQTVKVEIDGIMEPEDIPREVVVLPNIETFSLLAGSDVYYPAACISCPRAKHTTLINVVFDDVTPEIFPTTVSWNAIVRQYTTSPVEEVTFEITDRQLRTVVTYSLTFQSSDATVLNLVSEVIDTGAEVFPLGEINLQIFSQACSTICGHPLFSHVKRLHIKDKTGTLGVGFVPPLVDVVGELFRRLGPLDEFTIHGCDLQIFLAPFINLPEFQYFVRVFPYVKNLTISEARMVDQQRCMDGLVELVKSQYEAGKPFERVTVCTGGIPLAKRLVQWVGAVDCGELLE